MLASQFIVESNWPRKFLQGKLTLNSAAAEFKVSRQTAGKWLRRFRQGGCSRFPRSLVSSASLPPLVSPPELASCVEQLRRQRWTGVRIAQTTGLSRATISRILTGLRLNTARSLQPAIPIIRYEHPAPGDLLHIDIKKLARIAKPGHRLTGNPQDETRGAGWEFLYVAIDDHSRIAFTALLPDEKAFSASQLLASSRGLLRPSGHHRASRHDRQWPVLLLAPFRRGLPQTAHQTHPHAHLYAPHQRQSRTLHPDRHPRMGLRPALSKLRRASRS